MAAKETAVSSRRPRLSLGWIKRREQFARLAQSWRYPSQPAARPTDEPGILWDPFRDNQPPT